MVRRCPPLEGPLLLQVPLGDLFAVFAGSTDLPKDAIGPGRDYFQTRMAWSLPTLLTWSVAEYLRSVGKTRIPMAVDLLVHPLNIVFNWMLIFGNFGMPELGARGAALGTGLADCAGLLLINTQVIQSLKDIHIRFARCDYA